MQDLGLLNLNEKVAMTELYGKMKIHVASPIDCYKGQFDLVWME